MWLEQLQIKRDVGTYQPILMSMSYLSLNSNSLKILQGKEMCILIQYLILGNYLRKHCSYDRSVELFKVKNTGLYLKS